MSEIRKLGHDRAIADANRADAGICRGVRDARGHLAVQVGQYASHPD